MKQIFLMAFLLLLVLKSFSQGSPDYGGGMKVNLDTEGKKYFRILAWAQAWGQYNDNVPDNESATSMSLRRARILNYAQISDKFLILTHFGLNSLNSNSMSPLGKGEGSQLFLHDAWAQYSLGKEHAIGSGLHYWNGISRLNNTSTLNLLTLDNNRQSWATLGLSDQFARHIGIYAKGSFDKFQYRISINEAINSGLDARVVSTDYAVYGGRRLLGSKYSGKTFAGYFEYNFFDLESNFLPFKVGSYLGTKKIFNIGAGFFSHPKGSVILDGTELKGEDVNIFAVDAFYDVSLGENKGAITAYLTYQNNDYGRDYLYNVYGTGSMFYGHIGYLLPLHTVVKYQSYVSYASNTYKAVNDHRNIFGIGANMYMRGHNSKLSLEYRNEKFGNDKTGTVTLQAMIYL